MKFFKLPILVLAVFAVLFYSCKKENGISFEGQSQGKLKDSIGNCLPMNLEGTYNAGTPLVTENFMDVHVNIDSVGKYEILTDTLNGISFFGKGTLGKKGDNLIRLYGHGTPLSGGTYIYTVKYLTSRCRIAVKFTGTVIPPASYKLDTLAGACSGAVLEGTFSTRIATNGANKATLKVSVTTAGIYSLTTAPINGITFSGSGAFTTTGVQNIILTASGTPSAAGTFNHTASAGGVSCTFSVNVVEGPAAAVFTLGGAPSSCAGFTANGTYKAGTSLSSSNTVSCQVNITTAGAYSISTNTVNGISFSGSGTFTATGTQTVTLTGTGTPGVAGTNNFIATAGASTCTFSITTASGGTVSSDCKACSYYPVCDGSSYAYKVTTTSGTSSVNGNYVYVKDTTIGGVVYKKFTTGAAGGSGPSFYNCTSGVTTLKAYNMTSISGMSTVTNMELTLLKANSAVGTTWSNSFNTTYNGTIVQTAIYDWTLAEKLSSLSVLGVAYSDVIRVHVIISASAGGMTIEGSQADYYYAKGIGLILFTNSQLGIETHRQELVSYSIP